MQHNTDFTTDEFLGTPSPQSRENLLAALRNFEAAECTDDHDAWCEALVQLAQAYMAVGEGEEAVALLEVGVRRSQDREAGESGMSMLCDMAELAASIGEKYETRGEEEEARHAREQSRDCAYEAVRQAGYAQDPQLQVAVMLRAADLLDGLGDECDALVFRRSAMSQLWDADETIADNAEYAQSTRQLATVS